MSPSSFRRHHAAPAPTLPDLCRAAATAIETLCATLRDCAREVEARSGQRAARSMLTADIERAANALIALGLSNRGAHARVTNEMLEGCRRGYVRPTWALRLIQLAADAEPRDTVPAKHAEAPHVADIDHGQPHICETPGCSGYVADGAPEEHAGEGGT